jgi:predicted ATPase
LESARLLTVTGPAGMGKTRLAVEVARRTDARFVDLAPLRDERLVAERVAGAFGLGELRARDLAALVDAALVGPVVLVLDNCEHLIDACATVARALLAACGNVRILATSQHRLGVPGEVEWAVPPLDLRTAAVDPFCQRALAANRAFVASRDPEAIVEICRRLDANPLAIELAAARVRTLSPAEIATRLERRFQLLRSEPGTTEGRYQSWPPPWPGAPTY